MSTHSVGRPGGWWHIPLLAAAFIAAFFVAWELLETAFLADVPPGARKWLYIGRGVFGAACIGVLAGVLVRRQERRLALYRESIIRSEKLAVVGQMAAGVAHEIGNPLSSISCVVQMLERAKLDPTSVERLRLIEGEVDRINRIVRNMADLSRPPTLQRGEVRLTEVLDDVVRLTRFHPRAAGVRVQRQDAAAVGAVYAVRDHLMQVFLNVSYNALDAMADGGTLTIRTGQNDGTAEVEFADTGAGIAADDLPRVFQPFFTTKPAGRGTGLGLAVTRHLLEQNAGQIDIQSEAGRGTRVRIRMPLAGAGAAKGGGHG